MKAYLTAFELDESQAKDSWPVGMAGWLVGRIWLVGLCLMVAVCLPSILVGRMVG